MRSWRHRCGVVALAHLLLAACDMPPAEPEPGPRPDVRPPVIATAVAPSPSPESRALAAHYQQVEDDLLSRGLLRRDGGGPDTPVTETHLMRNFERIVFFNEYAAGAGYRPSSGGAVGLRKWTDPVRMNVVFGASVPEDQRAVDRAMVVDYAARLSRITGHPISATARNPNFHVLFHGEDDRGEGLALIRRLVPDIDSATMGVFRFMPRGVHCLVVAFSGADDPYRYRQAIVWIRAEHPALMREACVHEELAQGLGPGNDSADARPSIFNDDEEFALLTRHDEILLELLYDPALAPGMTVDEARPILRRLLAVHAAAGPV